MKQGRSMTEAGSHASISSVLGLQACMTRSHLKQTPPSLEKHTHPGFEFSQFWIPGELPEISHCLQDTKLPGLLVTVTHLEPQSQSSIFSFSFYCYPLCEATQAEPFQP